MNRHRKFLVRTLFFISVLWSAFSFGQTTVQVGTGTTVTSYPVYAFNSYNYSQQLYRSTDNSLSTYNGQYITAIRFYWTGSGNLNNANSWIIYLGNTTQTTFANNTNWVALGSMTKVYDGTVSLPGAAGWMTIILDAPFQYTGNSIVVAIDENVAGYTTSYPGFQYTTTTGNTFMRYSNDATNPDPSSPPAASFAPTTSRPNIQFDFFNTSSPTNVVSVSATSGTVSRSYPSLPYAFDAINSGIHKGDITIEVGSANNQTYTFSSMVDILASGTGSSNYSSILIRPAYSAITINSNIAASTFRLINSNYVTFDGRVASTGTTKDLTLENSNTGTSSKGVIELLGASNNTIRYCTLKSSTTSTSSGYGTVSMNYNTNSGPSNNLIEYCDITKSGTNLPLVAISSSNTSSSYYSQSNTVRYCTITDFKNAGIWLGNTGAATYNNLWTIDNNTFYLTSTIANGATAYSNHAIYIGYHASGSMTSTYNDRGSHTITNNTIGGNGGAKGNWTITGTSASNFVAPIYIAASNPSAGINTAAYSDVYGNLIKDFDVQTQNFAGIYSDKSRIKVGNSSTGNSVNNITLNHASSSNGGTAAGIYVFASANYSNEVVKNNIYNVTADAGSGSATFWYNFYGVYDYAGSSVSTNINSGNVVYNISTTKAPSTYGIYVDGNAVLNHVSRIKINHVTGLLYGIYWVTTGSGNAANYRVENNEIILGLDKDGNPTATAVANDIVGITLASQYAVAYYNSIIIQGSSSSDRSACLRLNFSGTGSTIKNNLLYNERTGGAGKHLCITTAISLAGNLVSSNNTYVVGTGGTNKVGEWATGTGVALGYTAGSLKATLSDWIASATNETNSISETSTNKPSATLFPNLAGSNNLNPAQDKWLCAGVVVTPTTDFDGAPMERHDPAPTTIGAYEIDCPTLLPIELLYFEGSYEESGNIKLNWATGSELNNDYFTIEKSKDGKYFEPIIKVKGAGTSNTTLLYSAADTLPYSGINYYRLKQTDFDGTSTMTEVISVDVTEQTELNAYPNPFTDYLIIKTGKANCSDTSIKMTDISGRDISINCSRLDNSTFMITINEKISDGIYFIKIRDNNECSYLKIIKTSSK